MLFYWLLYSAITAYTRTHAARCGINYYYCTPTIETNIMYGKLNHYMITNTLASKLWKVKAASECSESKKKL